ncbi:MAG: AMP-binding protein [Clostridiales bacterium]|nr:AMP-binding protein [Clostridiales bacterium]
MKNADYPLYPARELTDLRQLLEQKALDCPEEPAFRYMAGRKAMVERTYGQFYRDVRALGTFLLKHYTVGRKIALISENSYYWLVAYFAIVTTGNVAVLISKDSTDLEASTLVFQSDVDMIVTSEECEGVARFCKAKYGRKCRYYSMSHMNKWLAAGYKALDKGKKHYDRVTVDPDALACIFFTSGSTGFSKGVMLTQRNITTDITGMLQLVDPTGSVMSVLPFTHAFGLVVGLMVPFFCQMPVFICSSLSNFMREIPLAKPTFLVVVPLFVETFSKTIWRTAEKQGQAKTLRRGMAASDAMLRLGIDRRRKLFATVLNKFGGELHTIICGGAPLDPRFVKEFRSLGVEIINGYGITECSPVLSANRNDYHRDGSVGLPVPGVELKIANPDDKGRGEVAVRGLNVMLGYYHDPKSTSEVIDSEGWFYTGDLGYLDEDGFLFITGRKKSVIILSNGENVSPEEIEQYVERIDEVQEVVVYADENAITAEVYPDPETGLNRKELVRRIQKQIDKLNASLPSYKHIQRLKIRDKEFEKTSTRKIKRYKATPKQAEPEDAAPVDPAAPALEPEE